MKKTSLIPLKSQSRSAHYPMATLSFPRLKPRKKMQCRLMVSLSLQRLRATQIPLASSHLTHKVPEPQVKATTEVHLKRLSQTQMSLGVKMPLWKPQMTTRKKQTLQKVSRRLSKCEQMQKSHWSNHKNRATLELNKKIRFAAMKTTWIRKSTRLQRSRRSRT